MCVRKTPLAEVFHFFPGNGARKSLIAILLGNLKSKVLMNIAARFPSVKKPRYADQEKSRQYD
jgi:hypothetical protein